MRVTSMPSIEIRPAVARTRPTSVFISVVLPTPLWPTMPTASPACSCEVDAVQDRNMAVRGAQAGDFEDDVARGARVVGGVARERRDVVADGVVAHFARLPM